MFNKQSQTPTSSYALSPPTRPPSPPTKYKLQMGWSVWPTSTQGLNYYMGKRFKFQAVNWPTVDMKDRYLKQVKRRICNSNSIATFCRTPNLSLCKNMKNHRNVRFLIMKSQLDFIFIISHYFLFLPALLIINFPLFLIQLQRTISSIYFIDLLHGSIQTPSLKKLEINQQLVNISSDNKGMLVVIIHTINYGKFVLFKYPYQRISIQNQSFEKLPLNDFLEAITETFDYFAIYRKNSLIPTSNGALPEKAVVQMFMANQKCSQVVMGIDDDCVLVTRSAFFSNRLASQVSQAQAFSESACFMDIPETSKSQVISLSIIWRQESFNELQGAKHRLSFLLGMLQRKEQHEQFLTKEIIRIMQQKQRLKRRIKDLLSSNIKQNAMTLQEIRMKLLARQIESMAKNMRDQLPLFNFLKSYYESWIKGQTFEVKEYNNATNWQGTIGKEVAVGYPPQQFCEEIKHKSLVILPPKLAELPPVLYSDRVRKLYEKGFSIANLPINKLLQLNKQIQPQELFHTAYFLLRNRLAVDIYPINHPHSYNLFYLKDLPQRSLIQKFNNKIFPGKNFLEVVNGYSKYKLALSEEQTLKYLILKGIVGQVEIFIYRKFTSSDQKLPQSEGIFANILEKYNMVDKNLNYLLATEPYSNKQGMLLSKVFKFIKNNPKEWGFFFVQKS